jgi:hypothetical protein
MRAPESSHRAMDFFDFLAFFPIGAGGSSRDRPPEENVSQGVALTVFPILDFVIVLFAGVWKDATVSFIVLPAAFTLVSVLLSRRLEVGGGFTAVTAIGCAIFCLLASGIGGLLGGFASFFSTF